MTELWLFYLLTLQSTIENGVHFKYRSTVFNNFHLERHMISVI